MKKWLLLFLISSPVFATVNGTLIQEIGDALYLYSDGETYDCADFEEVQSSVEAAGQTLEDPKDITGSLCRILKTRAETKGALEKLAEAIGQKDVYVLTPEESTDDLNHIPDRPGFLTSDEVRLLASREEKVGEEEKKSFFYGLLNPLYTGDDLAKIVGDVYTINVDQESDKVEENVKRNNELLFALDVQGKSLAELSFERSLAFDANAPEGLRALCKNKETLQGKMRCDFIYQMMMAKTLWEIVEISNFAAGMTSKRLIEGIPKVNIFEKWTGTE